MYVCALGRMKVAGVGSRSARARTVAIIGSEMSMPMQWGVLAEEPRDCQLVLPVPQLTPSTLLMEFPAETASTSSSSKWLEYLVE